MRDSALVYISPASGVYQGRYHLSANEFALAQNYPNPFNPVTAIEFSVKEPCHVTLKVYDILGREVITLADADYATGVFKVHFDAHELPTGIYFYRVKMKDFVAVKKMVLLE